MGKGCVEAHRAHASASALREMGATEVIGRGGAGPLDAMLANLERVREAGAAEGVESTS